ncbi:protein cueball, partial [Nilaparvata lugens]|uniref:protein cueball n=1 Tax=Nilaparvata lugens TaxID=108931 RepID=UPI00193E5D0A
FAVVDIAVGVQHTVELLSTDEAVEVVEDVPLGKGVADVLGYDSIRNQLYYEDADDESISIFRVNLTGNNFRRQPIVTYQTVRGIAVDPISSILYWTSDNAIKWLNVSEEITTPQEGNTLISFEKDLPHGIAVDVCNRYIFLCVASKSLLEITFINIQHQIILYSAYQSNVVCSSYFKNIVLFVPELSYLPLSVVVVQKKIYWLESFSRKALFSIDILHNESNTSKVQPKLLRNFRSIPFGIITSQQDSNLASKECKPIADKKKQIEEERKSKLKSHVAVHFENKELLSKFDFCLNYGTLVADKAECLCPEGFEGPRCEVNLCHNFCVAGECRMLGGAPRCQCPPHRSGSRCQVERCAGYCLNGGSCSLDETSELQCSCADHYTGNRCQHKLPNMSDNKLCNIYCHMQQISHEYRQLLLDSDNLAPILSKRPDLCSCPEPKAAENCTGNSVTIEEISPEQCATDNVFSGNAANMLYILICVCCILLFLVTVLAVKAWNLHKRPRIKKRIIVNKQPLTCRPQTENEQCEITIENCCNMNICETPCFEPDFRKPSGKDNNNKKEEKRNLLGGIELPPDDLY